MLQLLVVDENEDRRAATVDALCELAGIEVYASLPDAARSLAVLDYSHADIIVAASDMAGASIVTLIDGARRRGSEDIVVVVHDRILLPGMKDYWRDLGARAFVDTLPELITQVQTLAKNQLRTRDRRWQIAQKIENALFAPEPDVIASQSSADGTTTVAVDRRATRSRPLVSIGDVLQEALPRLARVINDEIELVLESELDAPRVRCAAIDIERIALHLVQDAASAIPLGGKIWLFVERQGQRDVRIEVLDSSGNSRIAGPNVDSARLIVDRYFGALKIVDLGGATALQAVLPAVVDPAN